MQAVQHSYAKKYGKKQVIWILKEGKSRNKTEHLLRH